MSNKTQSIESQERESNFRHAKQQLETARCALIEVGIYLTGCDGMGNTVKAIKEMIGDLSMAHAIIPSDKK